MRGLVLVLNLINLFHLNRSDAVKLITCAKGSHRCGDNSKCVLDKDLCDYQKDCDDFSDERFQMCRTILEKRGTCPISGQIHHRNRGCISISDICAFGSHLFEEQFHLLCNEIKDGLKANEEIAAISNEVITLQEEVAALQKKSKLEDLFEHLASSFNETIPVKNDSACPALYVNIGDKCASVFIIAEVTWAEAKQFCESISGTLAVLRKMKDYEVLLKHLKKQDLTTNFWIGGHYLSMSDSSSSWAWLDKKEIVMGAPFWSLYQTPNNCTKRGTSDECYQYAMAPRMNREGFCLSMDYAHYYYFTDQNCHEKRSPLCFLNEK